MTATGEAGRSRVPPAREGRSIDRGAVFAGWVGLGTGLIVAIAFELILAVQPLVFIAAPLAGAVLGAYANVRSGRWRPRRRVLANAAYAGLVTGVGLAVLYAAIRLLFVYADTGYPAFNRTDPAGQPIPPFCMTGPDCTYQRYLAAGRGAELQAAGITDAGSFEAYLLRDQLTGVVVLVSLTLGGALAAGGLRALRSAAPESATTLAPEAR